MTNIAILLTEHMDIWTAADTEKKSGRGRASGNAGTVYGVKKLRELILELAVRGKLVPQDQNDEPASELLKRIQAEKTKLIAEGKLKKEKLLAPISGDEKPFELPNGWEFVRLETISDINGGFAFKSTSYTEDGVRVIRISDFDEKGFKDDKIVRYKYSSDLEQYRLAPKNILMAMTGGTVGKSYLVKELEEDMVVNQRVATIKLMSLVMPEYISNVLQTSSVQSVIQEAKNSTNDNISMLDIKEFFIPIPSLAEQHRIVAKVDELMALCDQLEQQHSNAQEAHETLVSQLLATLTQSQNATEFNANWQRIYAHFDLLFSTEASIDALKQTLLQLAVMGKLVPQDPNDEPASELYKRIKTVKDSLIKQKIYQKTGALNEKRSEVKYPPNWLPTQIGEICPSIVPSRDKPKSFSGKIPWVTLPAFPTDSLYLDTSKTEMRLSNEEIMSSGARVVPVGSLLMSCVGRFGLTAINLEPVVPNQQIHAFVITEGISPEFLSIVIRSSERVLNSIATSTTVAYLNKSNCESLEFGLPPTAEQHRIVAKVDALMVLCGQLKTRIQQANQQQQAIADALVAQAVA